METLILYLECAGMSACGALLHLFLKLDTTSKKAIAAKESFTVKQFLWDEKFAIGANIIAQIMVLVWMPELIRNYPAIEGWIVGLNGLVGYTGSSLLSKVFGAANKKVDKIIDDKTK